MQMQHLAVIMDGNRRWAKENELKSKEGHKKGKEAVRLAIEFCIKNGIKHLSLYTFSLENFRRTKEEQDNIFEILVSGINNELDEFIKEGVNVKFVGDKNRFPKNLVSFINKTEKKTAHLNKLHLNLLFCYGAQQEIVHATKLLARKVKNGEISIDDIDENAVKSAMWTADTPDPDLIVRTGGNVRMSNFLLYQAAYSEFAFLDCFWPEITEAHLKKCMDDFVGAKRNFGH